MNENLTLSAGELAACSPILGEGGKVLRARCPFHGGDHQRSLRVRIETGRFQCFACGAWGYTEEARAKWQNEREQERHRDKTVATRSSSRPAYRPLPKEAVKPASPLVPSPTPPAAPSTQLDLAPILESYQQALPGSLGESFLCHRGIPLAVAQSCGLGYAAPGQWAHRNESGRPIRDWRRGRLVFPHHDPSGRLVNLYGRAVGQGDEVPKSMRHDHLPGTRGYFRAQALDVGGEPLFICEGPFDALSLIAAGYRATAIFGVNGWRWEWARPVRRLVFALDADSAGQSAWHALAREACLRGKQVAFLPPEAYGGHKDVNEASVAGVLSIGEWPWEDVDDYGEDLASEAGWDDVP